MNLPRISCSVKSVVWGTESASIGESISITAVVLLKAARSKDAPKTKIEKEFEVEFQIQEYSGCPPQQGGGSYCRDIVVLKNKGKGSVSPGESLEIKVSTNWTINSVSEESLTGDLPEFRCKATINGSGPCSNLLKIGSISSICWQQLEPAPKPFSKKNAEFWFQDDQRVGLRLEGTGMNGFKADFKIYNDPDNQASEGNQFIRTLNDIPVRSGIAETEWSMTSQELQDYSFGNFKFEVSLHHPNLPVPIHLPKFRSRNIRHTATIKAAFILYYIHKDNAFKKAAQTIDESFATLKNDRRFILFVKAIRSETDFSSAWNAILAQVNKYPSDSRIAEGHILSHASFGTNEDGLEFAPGTLNEMEMASMSILPWASNARLVLHGCNTGIEDNRGWCPAGAFAKRQKVKTIGQQGYAYFSSQDTEHSLIPLMAIHNGDTYLWAYDRSHNNKKGDGHKLPGVEFLP